MAHGRTGSSPVIRTKKKDTLESVSFLHLQEQGPRHLPGALLCLPPCAKGAQGSDDTVNAQQDQIGAGEIVDRSEGEQGAEEHHEAQD